MAESRVQDWSQGNWPQRNWALAILGVVCGLAIQQLAEGSNADNDVRAALAATIMTGGVAFAFTLDRDRIRQSAAFAAVAALLVGATVYLNAGLSEFNAGEGWQLLCSILAVVIAAPLFQGWCDAGQPRPPRLSGLSYPQVHDRAWINVLLWFACWLFAGIVFLLVKLLAELFLLIGLSFIRTLLNESWFVALLVGGSFGAASGLLRDKEGLLVTLQTVVRRVLSVLAPVFGFGLVAFLLALPFTGLDALWEATKSTTPILLSCVIGALVLANAAIGDSSEDEAQLSILRWGAMALGIAILPLATIAAISTGLRIGQYGLTPERLWAVVFVSVALAFGAGYLFVIARQRLDWFAHVRPLNLRLAALLCGLAFILATPMVNFGAWSTQSQLARLEGGKVSPDKFDWAAMKFNFGRSGVAALEGLAKSGTTPAIRTAAAKALKLENRWEGESQQRAASRAEQVARHVSVKPKPVPLPPALLLSLSQSDGCTEKGACMLFYEPGAKSAVAVVSPCQDCSIVVQRLTQATNGEWSHGDDDAVSPQDWSARNKAAAEAIRTGKVEVRDVRRRQVFIDGKPVGIPFE